MDAKYAKYFKTHPKVDKFYFTSDGLAHTDAKKATTHQDGIRGKNAGLQEYIRKDYDEYLKKPKAEDKKPNAASNKSNQNAK